MHKKLVLTVVVFLVCMSFSLFSQVAADPDDFFYTDLDRWETQGLVYNLPHSRPFPLPLVKDILDTVLARGNAAERVVAREHKARVFDRAFFPGARTEAVIETSSTDKQFGVALAFDLNYLIEPFLAVSGSIDVWAINKLPETEILPANKASLKDLIWDDSVLGSFHISPNINTSFSVGNTEYYAQAGLMRGSWGPIHSNGVILGKEAFHAGQFSFVINKEKWGFDTALYSLVATSVNNPLSFHPEKFFSIHSLDWRPFPWLSISLIESVVYGRRVEPLYLLPFSAHFMSQTLVGFADNSYLGGAFTVRPMEGLKIDGVFYADDIGFKDIVTFKKDRKFRAAGQLAASWAPQNLPVLRVIRADYTMVTPYTYAHMDDDNLDKKEPNYQNYMHANQHLGAVLQPNSDRLNLSVTITPLERVDIDIFGTFIRHANVNENLEQQWVREYVTNPGNFGYVTDGSVNNSAYVRLYHASNHANPFLNQDTLQYILQTGLNLNCRLPILKTGGYMQLKLGYLFELNKNQGVNNQMYTKDTIVDASDIEAVDAAGAAQLAAWKIQAIGQDINNYFSISLEYFY